MRLQSGLLGCTKALRQLMQFWFVRATKWTVTKSKTPATAGRSTADYRSVRADCRVEQETDSLTSPVSDTFCVFKHIPNIACAFGTGFNMPAGAVHRL